jgi:hypothetical protein
MREDIPGGNRAMIEDVISQRQVSAQVAVEAEHLRSKSERHDEHRDENNICQGREKKISHGTLASEK